MYMAALKGEITLSLYWHVCDSKASPTEYTFATPFNTVRAESTQNLYIYVTLHTARVKVKKCVPNHTKL